MSSVSGVGGVSVPSTDLKGLDLETAMMMVQSKRAELLESSLTQQLQEVQNRNKKIAQLNDCIALMNKTLSTFPADAKSDAKLTTTSFKDNDYQREKEINTLLAQNGLTPFDKNPAGDDWSGRGRMYTINANGTQSDRGAVYNGGCGGNTTKAQMEAAIKSVQSAIDGLNNSQQMDMLRLQSLSNKRNEAFDLMTNFIKKMADSRSSILGNMR